MEKSSSIALFLSLYFLCTSKNTTADSSNFRLSTDSSHLKAYFVQDQNDLSWKSRSVLTRIAARINEKPFIESVIRCFGRDERSQNCRACIKDCVQGSKLDENSRQNSVQFLDDALLTTRMCKNPGCMDCVVECRNKYGRKMFLVRNRPGTKCGMPL